MFFLDFTFAQLSSFNETEAYIYNYVMQNKNQVLEESIRELANHVHVSTATIMRFCKKIGCSGFTEFKYKLKESLAVETYEQQFTEFSFGEFMKHVSTHKYSESIQKAGKLIKDADSFYILGLGPFGGIAKYMSHSFTQIGYYCYKLVAENP